MKLDRDERYLCPHGNEQVEAVDLEELREAEAAGGTVEAAAVAAPDAPADLDAEALAFVQEMRRRRLVRKALVYFVNCEKT